MYKLHHVLSQARQPTLNFFIWHIHTTTYANLMLILSLIKMLAKISLYYMWITCCYWLLFCLFQYFISKFRCKRNNILCLFLLIFLIFCLFLLFVLFLCSIDLIASWKHTKCWTDQWSEKQVLSNHFKHNLIYIIIMNINEIYLWQR